MTEDRTCAHRLRWLTGLLTTVIKLPLPLLPLLPLVTASPSCRADRIDDFIEEQMRQHHIPGLSLAIVQDGRIVKAKGYGVTEWGGCAPVTASTLFQAGSISKAVAALGTLKLVEEGRISLDEDVNPKLTTWKVPENDFTKQKKVTLRGILSHTAGLTVHGFPGYAVDAPQPTLLQVLNGTGPANTAPICVDILPGSRWRYSGGGYTVMQQMLLDITRQPFPQFMKRAVLNPLGMHNSTYEQPLPPKWAEHAATGHYADGRAIKGRWHVYPEMAAAGLWTTATDLVRFAIGVQKAVAGTRGSVLSQMMARQMLTEQKDGDGLGVFLEGRGKALRFGHDGRDAGFDAFLTATAQTGQAAAVMININDNSGTATRILQFIANENHWPRSSVEPNTVR